MTRPQPLMLSFLGIYLLERHTAVYSGSIIDVFARVGVSEEAVRSTLTRMAGRGLLERHRRGRRVYFGLTQRATDVLADGARRVWQTGAVNRDWDGTWTLVAFSMPEGRRSDRHDLRSQLIWAGFGLLQNGLWIAPGHKDAAAIVEQLGLTENVTVFTAQHAKPTESADLVHKAFDTDAIAARYKEFLARWDTAAPLPSAPDDLARQLILHTDWLNLVRQDPHLPAEHLAGDWPAIRAEETFQALANQYQQPAADIARQVIEEISVRG
ncbi:PaaX family transcriptional regulator C-terminal domain-containing protein [Kibdelosporangium persicum]|uniref:Phenylacetic acid degradation operon negative regulatory protein PaaX n=1 Tax=Kibdelosporangium persicum TaxID=2698649 RepID=A0ABX2EW56_9PSEU|nr:PaaX family transcriptional regulator C-terminal domain-containing protein [Kibdelosporangium persicum]NRN63104.1 Phenylacetic acid degradation operon negative regulatory protein PaaX [Kibdelosporangium persicum]